MTLLKRIIIKFLTIGSPVKAYDKGSWNGESLSIPSTIPTLNAGIIKVEYFLKVKLH